MYIYIYIYICLYVHICPYIQVDTAHQLTRALNILVLRLAQQAPVTTVFASLLRLIKGCIPEIKHESSVKKIISPGSKVISRLILRVVSDEVSRMNSFQRDHAMMKRILYGLHCFFNGHPEITADEIPFCTAKTLLDQVMKSVGGEKVASIMNGLSLVTELSYHVPKNSLLSKLVSKYLNAINSNDNNAVHGTTKDHQEMVNIIDDITSARDKSIPIQKLHHLISANPDIDVHAYLQRISSAFRKFVLDALTKLDGNIFIIRTYTTHINMYQTYMNSHIHMLIHIHYCFRWQSVEIISGESSPEADNRYMRAHTYIYSYVFIHAYIFTHTFVQTYIHIYSNCDWESHS